MSSESGQYFKALNLMNMWNEFSLHPSPGNPSLTHGLVPPFGGQWRLLHLYNVKRIQSECQPGD